MNSGDLPHVSLSLVAFRGLGDVVRCLFGIALGLEVETKVEVAVELTTV